MEGKDLYKSWFDEIVELIDECNKNNYDAKEWLMEIRAHAKSASEYIENFDKDGRTN